MTKFKHKHASKYFTPNQQPSNPHTWVTVVNPVNKRLLLQACDDCGVVKSENSMMRHCNAKKDTALISSAMNARIDIAV